jgi:hypothetical protein
MFRTSILVTVALLLGACVGTLEPYEGGGGGGDDGDDTGGGVARSMFDADVAPLLAASCASCHTGAVGTSPLKFLGTGAATGYYPALTQQLAVTGNFVPANATLLNKGLHDLGNAPAWTQIQADAITEWLLAEAQER